MRRALVVLVAGLTLALAGSAPALASPSTVGGGAHACLIRDTAHPAAWHGVKWFPTDDTWNFTQGQFVGRGGTYKLIRCR